MGTMLAIQTVRSSTGPEGAIRSLVWATSHNWGVLSRSALHTLIQLTAMAHPAGTEGDIVSGSFPSEDLNRLELYGFIKLDEHGVVELV